MHFIIPSKTKLPRIPLISRTVGLQIIVNTRKSVKWIQHTSPDTDNNRLYIQSTSITKSTQVLEQYSTLINKSIRCTKMQNSFSVISMCYWLFLKLPCTYQTVLLKTRTPPFLNNTGVVWHLKQSARRTARRNIRASFEFISVTEITFRYQTC